MKRSLLLVLVLGLLAGPAWAQQFKSITLPLQTAQTGDANGNEITIDGMSSLSVQVTVSGTATVHFEATQDQSTWASVACIRVGDTAYASITDTSETMTVRCNVAGLVKFRTRTSGNSGSVTSTATASPAVMGSGGGGGGGGGLAGLDANFDVGNEINSATSDRPLIVGNGTQKGEQFGDPTMGFVIRPNPLGDSLWRIWTDYKGCIRDEEAGANMLCFDPDAATPKLKYPFQTGYYPLKSVFVGARSMIGDGTNCPAQPTVVTISNFSYPTFICTENNGSRMKFALPMRPNWDGGVVYMKPYYAQTAADTGSVALEVAAACRANGVAFNGTYGTEVEVDDAVLAGSGAIESTLSASVTPNGTCAAGDWLLVYIDIDATDNPTTAAATLHFLGVDVFWSETSLSH